MPQKGQVPAEVTFTGREVGLLRTIVTDWVNTELVVRPFPEEIMVVVKKLDIPEDRLLPEELVLVSFPVNQG